MSGSASIDVLEGPGSVVMARLEGELDLENADEVASFLLELVPDGAAGLAIELGGLTYVDSAGIRAFVELSDRLGRNGQRLALAVPADAPVDRVFSLVKLDLLVPIRETIQAAAAEIE